MSDQLMHRGPDSSGVWSDAEVGIGLSHRRLAILDLSDAGQQPMISKNQRYIIVFNGEIYNHLDIRAEIEAFSSAPVWSGYSDTETILEAISRWGILETLKRLNGMFAFAVWDRQTRELVLARDRMGEKPLYFGLVGGCFVFGSELKALKSVPGWEGTVNRAAIALYLRYNYIPAPLTIYEGIQKLPPAHFVRVSTPVGDTLKCQCYWDLAEVFSDGADNPLLQDPQDVANALEEQLSDAVRMRMLSDVSLGAFLSGGIDSSLIVALMQANTSNRVKTFSIGFTDASYNEARYAKEVAQQLGTDHTEYCFNASDALRLVPDLPRIWDEPFADSSQLPTVFISRLARSHVTVALTGDGGDELFCGYNRYNSGYKVWKHTKILPRPLRRILANGLAALPPAMITTVFSAMPRKYQVLGATDRIRKLAEVLRLSDDHEFYLNLVSHSKNPGNILKGVEDTATCGHSGIGWENASDFRDSMMYSDLLTYLPDDILTKVDRASMSASLEARAPFLDHRVVELAQRIPVNTKSPNGQTKWHLRHILYKYVDRKIIERPKMGFGIPLADWLRGPLAEWAGDLLNTDRISADGYFDETIIEEAWTEHRTGRADNHFFLWNILMFQSWLRDEDATNIH